MKKKYYLGIDIGGTKISLGLLKKNGKIIEQDKVSSPKNEPGKEFIAYLIKTIDTFIKSSKQDISDITGIGIAVPAIIDRKSGKVLKTPNLKLDGINIVKQLHNKFKESNIAVENDVNCGLLGEKWMGSAEKVQTVIGLFPGTGVGGAVIIKGKLFTGHGGAAGELGHMIMDPEGPRCTCGNTGCLEAFTGRWAIERDIKQALINGTKSAITGIAGENPDRIKSGMLKTALEQEDKLITEILSNSARILGLACISLRHIFDPECIVFGGGLVEACGDFLLPKIKDTVRSDPFFSELPECNIVPAKLQDNASLLGAASLVIR